MEPREEIAIVGIGCRFPGSANSPEEFWALLREGRDAIIEVPPHRANLMEVYDPDPKVPGRSYLRRGGFMDGIDVWDADFFGVSPREAAHIDPQHRVLLEVAWEALEDAGQDMDRLAGTRTGVFVGISTHDYSDTHCDPANRALLDSHSNSGNATSIAANRISYLYDLRGPSLTVDTACSSSLTATHLACNSILAGECDVAIVGGVQMQINPELTIGFCKANMISLTGECRAFDASANGYVRSEGAGAVVLKRLSAAIADGDDVYAVIAGSAINQDGRTNGMTVPSADAQEAMLREALASARLSATDVQYVEAHGTGTPVGDPLETQALGAVFREGRAAGETCAIGSVKTNIGHLEAAAGIAGLIKTALCVQRRALPPSLNFDVPHPAIDFEGGHLRVVTALEPWPSAGRATAGVNSFGFGGANAHVILREAPAHAVHSTPTPDATATLIPLSARSPGALRDLARRYMTMLGGGDATSLVDVACAAAHRRAHHDHRLAITATTRDDAVDALDAFLAGEARATVAAGRRSDAAGKLAFVFSGMGPQWWGMGQQLRAENRVFREMLERCHEALKPHASWGLLDELARDEHTSRIAEPDLAQVTNFAIQVALAEVWKSWGIVPGAVVGHSAGEMAAAYTAGALSLEDAVKVSYHRSRLQSEALPGKIIAVGMGPEELTRLLADYGGELDLAAVNSPVSCTVAGGAEAIVALSERLQRDQVFARILSFAVAYHSAKMEPIREELTSALFDVKARPATIPIISTITGTWAEGTVFGPSYWFENVRRTVRFADAIQRLVDEGFTTLLEQAPHPVLAGSINECLAPRKTKATVLASLRRKDDERAGLLRTLGVLYTQGRPVRWDGVFEGHRSSAKLPSYPWQRERHWFESAPPSDMLGLRASVPMGDEHPLLGRRVRAAHPLWESLLSSDRLAYLDDHLIQGTVLFPGAAHVEMALAAAEELRTERSDEIVAVRNVVFKRALFLSNRERTLVQLGLDETGTRFEVHGASADVASADTSLAWTLHASGELGRTTASATTIDLGEIRTRCTTTLTQAECYAALAEHGFEYGPTFRGIAELWTGNGEALGRVDMPLVDPTSYHLHPALLDAAFQLLISAGGGTHRADADGNEEDAGVFLPVLLREITVHAPTGTCFWAHAKLVTYDREALEADIRLTDGEGRVLVSARGFRAQRLERPRANAEGLKDWLYEYQWEERPLATAIERSVIARSTTDIATDAQPRVDALGSEWNWDEYYTRVEPRFTELTLAYMTQAVRALAAEAGIDSFTLETLGVASTRHKHGAHVVGVLEAEGVLAQDDGVWRFTSASPEADPDALARDIAAEHPAHALDVELLVRCGSHLAQVMSGRTDAGAVLFSDEGFDLLTRFYYGAPPSRFYNLLVAEVIASIVADRDVSRPLRVLEIGGGTGSTTELVLPALEAAGAEFVFTDITPFFTEQGKRRFAGHAAFSARTLDIEKDVASQGFAPHSFDIVLAANVIHATPSLAESLANAKQLLAPGGVVVLIEITRHPIWTDLIFGLTDGWWRYDDHDVRPRHPLLAGEAWKRVLTDAGFESAAAVTDSAHEGEAAQSVLIAQARVEAPGEVAPVADHGDWLVFADRGGAGAALVERLVAGGTRTTIAEVGDAFACLGDGRYALPPGDSTAATRLFTALDEAGRTPRGVVHLWALDSERQESVSPDHLLETQRLGVLSALAVVQGIIARGGLPPELWLATAGAQPVPGDATALSMTQTPLWGFGRVVTKEHANLRTRLIDLGAAHTAAEIDALAREVLAGEWEDELALRGDARLVRRLHRYRVDDGANGERRAPLAGEGYRAEVGTPGALESVGLRTLERRAPAAGEVEVAIRAAGMNFRDVMIALGLYPTIAGEASFSGGLLGLDCSGTISACGPGVTAVSVGDEVVGIGPGTFGAYVTTPAAVIARRPASLSVTQGAAASGVFVTAYYALVHLARLRKGERVLIHSATGGVGLAAIQIARDVGAEVFATAGSADKRAYLASLGIEHVMDSRSLRFADEIMKRTSGIGIDVVLNSLAGEAIARGIGVLRDGGRFVEIGKRDIYQDSRIGLLAFRKNLSFFGVDVDRLTYDRVDVAGEMLHEVMARFESGAYTPLPERVFGVSKLEDAMRFMGQAKHIGKVVLSMDDPDVVVAPSRSTRPLFRGDATYLITGGFGGFGLATAEWMVREGARNLALGGRSGPSAEVASRLEALRARGVRVEVVSADVSRADDVRRMLLTVRATMPPLRGIAHAAMVLDDAPLIELNRERMERVMAPKMSGAWHLHRETLDDDLDCFLLFSSITATFGNPLQANYAAANTYLDALAHARRALGMPALSINWGALSKIGYVSRHREVADYLEWLGWHAFSPAQAFEVIGTLLRRDATHVMAARVDWARWAESSPAAVASAMLRHFAPAPGRAAAVGDSDSPRAAMLAVDALARRGLVIGYLREKVGRVLGHAPARLDVERSLTELGFDSLIAVDLMTMLHVDLGVELAAVKLLQGVSIDGLAALVLEQLAPDDESSSRQEPVVSSRQERDARPRDLLVQNAVDNVSNSATHMAVPALRNTLASPPNGKSSRYASIDYSHWTPGQQAIRGVTALGLRLMTKMHVEGVEHIPRDGGCLLAINHLSLADTPVVLSLLPRRTIMFASEHLRSSKFMNWVLSDMGDAIYVRRGEGDVDALASGLAVLRAGGMLGLGPEGARSTHGLARGHTGVAYLATQAGVPVIPLAAWGQEHIPAHLRSMRRAPITVRVGAPLRFDDRTPDAARLREYTDQVMSAIAAMLPEEYRGVYRS